MSTNLVDVDNQTIAKTSNGIISLSNLGVAGTTNLPSISVDDFGRVISQTTSIYGCLTGNDATNINFNGNPDQLINGIYPIDRTVFSAISSNGVSTIQIVLSSAGWITFEGDTTTKTGGEVSSFAIPIFTF